MQQLTAEGQHIVNGLSQRHGFSPDAVTHMLFAVLNGNGSMAQFNHPEFAGSGQWMQGGMLMLGDMFNHGLKGRVDALCNEISGILATQPGLLRSGSFQSQSQSGGGQQNQGTGGPMGESSLFVPDPTAQWWPREIGAPSATGSQNNVRYAYFANARRLAVETNGQVWLYDTLDHQIGGFSQQQGVGGSILFTSQYGSVNLASLPVVSIDGQPSAMAPPMSPPAAMPGPAGAAPGAETDIFAAIERLADLRAKGILTEEEFTQKKAELLSRF
ncbi:SHOCT domain-containing protein [Thiorhodococcus mannitoliphagus]|uniref:SHOCT domain-containing protein n=1 Tax=Thiorhodococcus mannitoliphagus TaxID=329406 RepID=A0A6P1DY03_9GAMM|nr:SHOCT domain-containing protein [Thiorhodococcus mannitoliphagus]NEX22579.1 SHOCT domain-containing protein [Thiorhodococcus mannitoliphagus]